MAANVRLRGRSLRSYRSIDRFGYHGTPFGFMAFLGVASLIGVIVSHVIVLFDFIEEMHEKGEPLERALPDAGIERIRPVMIIVGATILALFPLALKGGPLWKPLCYAKIGGLAVATFITLLLVPVFYSIFVLDLDQMGNGREPEGTGGSIISDGLDSALRRGPPECWPCNMKIAFEKEPQNE
jgi:hypothetical protein